jgi:hypothetical protein
MLPRSRWEGITYWIADSRERKSPEEHARGGPNQNMLLRRQIEIQKQEPDVFES